MPVYKIADTVFNADVKYDYTLSLCKKYLCTDGETPETTIKITDDDIKAERVNSVGTEIEGAPDYFLENVALFRKLCDYLLENKDAIVFHSSAINYDGGAYLFTAPSGTGKSTHARLWRKLLGDKVSMINDDKPIIRLIDGEFFVYGTPWNGKHRLDNNCKVKVKAICAIYQAKENVIKRISASEMLMTMFNQTIRPESPELMDKMLSIADKLLTSVNLFKLGCNMDISAAETSFSAMVKGELC